MEHPPRRLGIRPLVRCVRDPGAAARSGDPRPSPPGAGRFLPLLRGVVGHAAFALARQPEVLLFLVASAVFRDGLAGVFTFGAIIAAQVFGFSSTQVLYFGWRRTWWRGGSTFVAGRFDDRFGPKRVIVSSLIGLIVLGGAVLFIGTSQAAFWITGLGLCAFVGPVQSASRSFLARVAPEGREGEIFGLYATTGRAVSFPRSRAVRPVRGYHGRHASRHPGHRADSRARGCCCSSR